MERRQDPRLDRSGADRESEDAEAEKDAFTIEEQARTRRDRIPEALQAEALRLRDITDVALDVGRIRGELARGPDVVINIECFNNVEADEIADCLEPAELERVAFAWRRTVEAHQTRVQQRRFTRPE